MDRTELERQVLEHLADNGESSLKDLAADDDVDGTMGEVFETCLDLEREGKVLRSRPAHYRLTDSAQEQFVEGQQAAERDDEDDGSEFIWVDDASAQ